MFEWDAHTEYFAGRNSGIIKAGMEGYRSHLTSLIKNPRSTLVMYLELIEKFGNLFSESSRKKLDSEIEKLTDELIKFNSKLGDKDA